jgi:hypothetical protein
MTIQDETEALESEWIQFCKDEYEKWKLTNPPSPNFINNPDWMFDWEEERKEKWIKHTQALGDTWWKYRGYQIIWHAEGNKFLQITKI